MSTYFEQLKKTISHDLKSAATQLQELVTNQYLVPIAEELLKTEDKVVILGFL